MSTMQFVLSLIECGNAPISGHVGMRSKFARTWRILWGSLKNTDDIIGVMNKNDEIMEIIKHMAHDVS